ncbi:DUF3037 domain-containing protein [Olivibacter sitiensis]|uniref:DUF3037 domain-containing protein n=1 Tax=Olivibacter sitiensis TaxID=376470 RepID=UPI0004136AE5|nr:DUF3037 domain-containing protein [Olivibacter sitiensis]
MKTFQYQLLQFQPDKVSGEFLNVGVVVFDGQQQVLDFDILHKAAGLGQVFPGAPLRYLTKQLHIIHTALAKVQHRLASDLPLERYESVDELTRSIFPKDDSSLSFSNVRQRLDLDIRSLTRHLSDRMISIRHLEKEKEVNSDKEVRNKIYRQYFEQRNITKHLAPCSVNHQVQRAAV